VRELQRILDKVNRSSDGPWSVHVAFETLHPYMDGNGRTGRAIWAWQMQTIRARSVRASVPASVLLSDAGREPLMDGIIESERAAGRLPTALSSAGQIRQRAGSRLRPLPFFGLATTSKETFCPS